MATTNLYSFISSSPLLVDSPSHTIPCFSSSISRFLTLRIATSLRLSSRFPAIDFRSSSRSLTTSVAVMLPGNSVLSDVYATGISTVVAFSCLGFWGEIGKRGIFDQVEYSTHIPTLIHALIPWVCIFFFWSLARFCNFWYKQYKLWVVALLGNGINGEDNKQILAQEILMWIETYLG